MRNTIALGKNQRILVINDNPHLIKDWRQLFEEVSRVDDCDVAKEKKLIANDYSDPSREVDFEIDSAFQGQEGLEKIRQASQEGCPYVVAFVDVRMPPGWDGVKTIEQIWAEYPDLPVVIHAPYSDYTVPEIVKRLGKSEKLLIFQNPPDNEAIHRFADALSKEWECNQTKKFEHVLNRAAKLPWANICDPDRILELAEKQFCSYCGEDKLLDEFDQTTICIKASGWICKECQKLDTEYKQIREKHIERETFSRLYLLLKDHKRWGYKVTEKEIAQIYCDVGLRHGLHYESPFRGNVVEWQKSFGLEETFWQKWSETICLAAVPIALIALPWIIGVILEYFGVL